MGKQDPRVEELNVGLAECAQAADPERLAQFLQPLGGTAVLAIKGTAYKPPCTKAFGSWVMLDGNDLSKHEEVDTDVHSRGYRGHAYLLSSVRLLQADQPRVRLDTEEYSEDAYIRVFFADEVEFSIHQLLEDNPANERERRYLDGQRKMGLLIDHRS